MPGGADEIPRVLSGRYEVRRVIGRGGMATVLEATDGQTGKHVAVKLMRPHQMNNFDAVMRFEREGAVIAQVEHVNLVSVLDQNQHEGVPYIVLELIEGPSLEDYIKRVGPLDPQNARDLMWQATQGLAALHRGDIIHRDIKPANLLLDTSDFSETVKIADFGFIQVGRQRLTDPGNVLGTASTMSPEQALGEAVDARSDIYALGTTLFFMLTGQHPFSGSTGQVLAQHLLAPPVAPSQLNPGVDHGTDQIVACALRKDPANRYPTADAMAQDIRRANPVGVPLTEDPDRYKPSTALGREALQTLSKRYF